MEIKVVHIYVVNIKQLIADSVEIPKNQPQKILIQRDVIKRIQYDWGLNGRLNITKIIELLNCMIV